MLSPDRIPDPVLLPEAAADYDVVNSNSMFGELIDHRLEVICASDHANSVDGAPDHLRPVIQYCHNAMHAGRVGPYEFYV